MAWNIFRAGKKFTYLQLWMEKRKGSCFCLSFILFLESLLLYVHITFCSVHTNFHSCSLYFVRSHIQTNRIAGKNDGVLTASVEEEIERCMLAYILDYSLSLFTVCTYYLFSGAYQFLVMFIVFCAFPHSNKKNS